MRRPLSIMRAADDWIEVLYKVVGEGLHLLTRKQPGDFASLLGPIGQPFQFHRKRPDALLIGGGVGIPPMVFIADEMRREAGSWRPLGDTRFGNSVSVRTAGLEPPGCRR